MDSLQQFARFVGITDSYVDGCGKAHKTTNKLYKYLLSAMNYRIDNQKNIQQEYGTELNNLYKNGLDYTNSFFVGGKFLCNLYIKEQYLNKTIKFVFVMEDSEKVTEIIETKINKRKILDTRTIDGEKYVKTIIYLQPKIPFGYYKFVCEIGKQIFTSFLLASPKRKTIRNWSSIIWAYK